jgi:ATP-dependent exoDNAse (exonuclease V) alpha subunit
MTAQELIAKKDFRYGCVFGPAGSGKTHLIREVLKIAPSWGIITATTGVAARMLGPEICTIHSTLGIFDLASIRHSCAKGDLYDILEDLHKRYERIVIDEVSMLGREMFEIIAAASEEIGIGLILVGDFLQLPPVPDQKKPRTWDTSDWLFRSQQFTRFAKNTITLQTQYRFNDADYITGINFLRAGKGLEAIPHFERAGVTFMPLGTLGKGFTGTAIVATKNQRDHINNVRFAALKRKPNVYMTTRSGTQRPEWAEIPDSICLKVGARVMVLRNLYEFGNLVQSNGDLGVVRELFSDAVPGRTR